MLKTREEFVNYTIVLESEGHCSVDMFDFDDLFEAERFCKQNDWLWEDENGFVWEMAIRYNWL